MVTWLFKAIVIGWILQGNYPMLKALYRNGSCNIEPFVMPSYSSKHQNLFEFFWLFEFKASQIFVSELFNDSDEKEFWRSSSNEMKRSDGKLSEFFFANDDCRRKSVGLTQKGHSFFTCCRFESWWLLPQCSLVAKLCNCCGSGGWAVNCWSQWPGFKSCSSRAP